MIKQLQKYQDETLAVVIAAGLGSTFIDDAHVSAFFLLAAIALWGFVLFMFSLSDPPEGDKYI